MILGLFVILVLLAAFIAIARRYWEQLTLGDDSLRGLTFKTWLLRGIVVPAFLWVFFNLNLLPGWVPLWPKVATNSGRARFTAFFESIEIATFNIASWWTAVTLLWLLAEGIAHLRPPDRRRIAILSGLWVLFCASLVIWWGVSEGWGLCGLAVAVGLIPAVHAVLPLAEVAPPEPAYAGAVARMKLGKWAEAEQAVLHELEKCADDFDGWMLLAEIYAVHFHDLDAADKTVRELCAQSNVNPSQASVALHRLADWHLAHADDPASARDALDTVSRCFPGTHLDRMARQRIARLPVSREARLEEKKGRVLRLGSSQQSESAGRSTPERNLTPSNQPKVRVPLVESTAPRPVLSADDAAAAEREVQSLVQKLNADPNDVEEREKLAFLLTEHLGRLELGLEQLELLIAMPQQAPDRIARWLYRMAVWQLHYRRDREAAKALFLRVVREYTEQPVAFEAQTRASLIDAELRLRRHRPPPAH